MQHHNYPLGGDVLAELERRLAHFRAMPFVWQRQVDRTRIVPTEEMHDILGNYLRTGKFRDEVPVVRTKGRDRRTVLTDDDVRDIRRRYDSGERQALIALDYPEVTQQNISSVCRRITRKNVA